MTEAFVTLAFDLYLIASCLFAPADKKTFEIELREGQQDAGTVMYVERTDAGFAIYGDKERKGESTTVKKDGVRYSLFEELNGKKMEYTIDNSKVGIVPLAKDGKYTKNIGGAKVIFECKDGVRKVYQEDSDRLCLVR